jgi:hypothetical protein
MRTPINQNNFELVKAFVKLIDIPQSVDICDMLDERYGPGDEEKVTESALPMAEDGLPVMPRELMEKLARGITAQDSEHGMRGFEPPYDSEILSDKEDTNERIY